MKNRTLLEFTISIVFVMFVYDVQAQNHAHWKIKTILYDDELTGREKRESLLPLVRENVADAIDVIQEGPLRNKFLISILGQIEDTSVLPLLHELVCNENVDGSVTHNSLSAILQIKSDESESTLVQIMNDESLWYYYRIQVAGALADFCTSEGFRKAKLFLLNDVKSKERFWFEDHKDIVEERYFRYSYWWDALGHVGDSDAGELMVEYLNKPLDPTTASYRDLLIALKNCRESTPTMIGGLYDFLEYQSEEDNNTFPTLSLLACEVLIDFGPNVEFERLTKFLNRFILFQEQVGMDSLKDAFVNLKKSIN